MKTMQNNLYILWQADVGFAVSVRPASALEKIVRPPCRRMILREAPLAFKGSRERYNRFPASEAQQSRSGLIVNFQSA